MAKNVIKQEIRVKDKPRGRTIFLSIPRYMVSDLHVSLLSLPFLQSLFVLFCQTKHCFCDEQLVCATVALVPSQDVELLLKQAFHPQGGLGIWNEYKLFQDETFD